VHIHIFQDQNIHGISKALLGSEHSSNIRISRAHYSIQVRETEPSMSVGPSVPQVSLAINFTFFFHQKLQLDHYTSTSKPNHLLQKQQTGLTRLKRYQ